MTPTRRETMAILATGVSLLATRARAIIAGDGDIDGACAPILMLLPDAAVDAGLKEAEAGGSLAGKCNDWSPDGAAALSIAVKAARIRIQQLPSSAEAVQARSLLDRVAATADIRYGFNDPLGSLHFPYLTTAFAGAHISVPGSLQQIQPMASAADVEVWQARLTAYGDALLGVGQKLRADQLVGCTPPAVVSRAALPQMDGFIQAPPSEQPLVQAFDRRGGALDPAVRDQAKLRATETLRRHVQPAMALLRDTLATLTRAGRPEIGVWAQPDGEALHSANVARAGDTAMSLVDIQAMAHDEAKRVADLLDRRLTARGLRKGSLADRIAAAFAAHPEFMESDDEGGRASLLQAARARIDAAAATMPHLLPPELAATAAPEVVAVPDPGKAMPGGSFYRPAAIDGGRQARLWLDVRSIHALPTPGVAPIAYHLGLPGLHLLASAEMTGKPLISRLAAWPAMTEGWGCYAERLAGEEGLFVRDPWGDIARLSDELLRAARLVVDIGIHAQRWPRAQAETEMQAMTGAAQGAAIDRIVALPGEAASQTLGLQRLLDLRTKAKAKSGKHFDLKAFHATVLRGGARPFDMVEAGLSA